MNVNYSNDSSNNDYNNDDRNLNNSNNNDNNDITPISSTLNHSRTIAETNRPLPPQALKALGITDLFSGASDLSNFAPRDKIAVSRVIHKAVIEVDEEGAEAAAVTAVIGAVIVSIQPPSPPVNFFCERPFFFAIVDTKLNNILFMGTFRKP